MDKGVFDYFCQEIGWNHSEGIESLDEEIQAQIKISEDCLKQDPLAYF